MCIYYLTSFKMIVFFISCLSYNKVMLCKIPGLFILSVALPALAMEGLISFSKGVLSK